MPRDTATADPLALLPEETAAGLRRLELAARLRKSGTLAGRHRGTHKGASPEFAEHREYVPGDDLRRLDWRVLAKRDRPFVRDYVEETNLRCTLVLDASSSMAFTGAAASEVGGRQLSKFDFGRYLVAALAHLLLGQKDAVGLVTFDTAIRQQLAPEAKASQLGALLGALAGASPGRATAVASALHEVANRIPQRGLVVLVSDLFDEPQRVSAALHDLARRGHELAVVHVMAEEELSFPFDRFTRFDGMEGEAPVGVDAEAVRADYLDRVREFVGSIASTCGGLGARYLPANTSTPYLQVLGDYLQGA